MSDLPEPHESLRQYHSALRQFLSVSPAPVKSNPARAAKAREKLLKLSSSQFFELSTDVYDELQRRISESQEEPDFLLPMENFHPKRNEAREKLGSLQQTRFRDLVSDIFYEIERRNALISKEEVHLYENPNDRFSSNTVLTNSNKGNKPQDRVSLDSKNSSNDGKKQGVVTLQPTTVVATKAEMVWSSDEEEEESNGPSKAKGSIEEIATTNQSFQSPKAVARAVTSQSTYASSNRTSKSSTTSPSAYRHVPSVLSHESPKLISSHRKSNASQLSDLSSKDTVGEMNGFTSNEPRMQRGLSINKNRNKDREIELLIQEGTKMDNKITDLEQQNNLLHTKAEKYEQEVFSLQTLKDNLTSKITKLESELGESQTRVSSLQLELNSKDSKIDNLQSEFDDLKLTKSATPAKTENTREINGTSSLQLEDSVWKTKYMELKNSTPSPSMSSKSILPTASLDMFTSPVGIIPKSLIVKLHDEIEAYLTSLSEMTDSQGSSNGLFEHMARITDTANKIACCAPQSEKAEMIRAALSHAITSTRYFSIYSQLLPKLVVESAVSQVAFSVFEFMQDVKLISDDSSFKASTPITTNGSVSTRDTNDAEVSPVRPLRMAKKSDRSNNTTPRSVSTTATPKPLNLTINSQLANSGLKSSERDLHTKDSPLASKTRNEIIESKVISKVSPVVAKYANDLSNSQTKSPPPSNGLRKSSSSNILSKVKQFEQQAETTPTSSPISKNPIISPLSENAIGMFGKKKVSESYSVNNRTLMDTIPASGDTKSNEAVPVKNDVSPQSIDSSSGASNSQISSTNNHGVLSESPISLSSAESPVSQIKEPIDLDVSPVKSVLKETPKASELKSNVIDDSEKIEVREPVAETLKSKTADIPIPTTTTNKNDFNGVEESNNNEDNDDDDDDDDDYEEDNSKFIDEDNFDVDEFDIEDPDNTLSELLLYLEHQTVKVISTIQALLTSIKTADSTKGELRSGSKDISDVVSQMVDATSNSMNQSRNAQLKEHGRWVVESLADSKRRMNILCLKNADNNNDDDDEYADKQFKQRLAGIAFDVAKCTKELVKSVEEANLKDEIAHLNARLR